jgi:hypothetical protein
MTGSDPMLSTFFGSISIEPALSANELTSYGTYDTSNILAVVPEGTKTVIVANGGKTWRDPSQVLSELDQIVWELPDRRFIGELVRVGVDGSVERYRVNEVAVAEKAALRWPDGSPVLYHKYK